MKFLDDKVRLSRSKRSMLAVVITSVLKTQSHEDGRHPSAQESQYEIGS